MTKKIEKNVAEIAAMSFLRKFVGSAKSWKDDTEKTEMVITHFSFASTVAVPGLIVINIYPIY